MQQSCLCCCTARRPGLSLEPSPPGLTALTVGLSDRFLAFTGTTSSPMKRCGPLPGSPWPPLWLPADGSAGMDMCFACHSPSFSGYPGLRTRIVRLEAPRGASRTRWIDVVRRDLDQLGLDPAAIELLAQDRDEWRALVNLVGSTHDTPRGAVHETR